MYIWYKAGWNRSSPIQDDFCCRQEFLLKNKNRTDKDEIELCENLTRLLLENVLPAHVAALFVGENKKNEVGLLSTNTLLNQKYKVGTSLSVQHVHSQHAIPSHFTPWHAVTHRAVKSGRNSRLQTPVAYILFSERYNGRNVVVWASVSQWTTGERFSVISGLNNVGI